jgi:hypothetical protein
MPDPAGSLRRSHPPASQAPADHPPAAGVNPDASLFYRAPGSGLVERRGGVAPMDHFGSAVRPTGPPGAEPAARNPRRNRLGRGRSSYRSRPACGSPRRGTAAPTPPRHATPTRRMDERHDCQDIGSAYVPGTVWGTASSLTAKFRSRRRACLSTEPNLTHHRRRVSLPPPMPPGTRDRTRAHVPRQTISFRISNQAPLQAIKYLAPDSRGFRQPSTVSAQPPLSRILPGSLALF